MFYVDTSAMVSALTSELATSRVQHWLVTQQAGSLAVSDWTVAEFSAALSVKLRMGHVDQAERELVLSPFEKMSPNLVSYCQSAAIIFVRPPDWRTNTHSACVLTTLCIWQYLLKMPPSSARWISDCRRQAKR